MTNEEIMAGNKLIADSPFASDNTKLTIQHYVDSGNDVGLKCYYESLYYNKSWNELMPVVEKIEEDPLVSIDIYKEATSIKLWGDGFTAWKTLPYNTSSKIGHVWQAVINYITMRNKE